MLKEMTLQKKKKMLQHMFGFLYFRVTATLSELHRFRALLCVIVMII